MTVVEVNDAEDLVAQPAKPRLDIAPGMGRRGKRPVATQPGLHPAGVQFVQGMHAGAVLGGQEEGTERVVGVIEEFAQAPHGSERRDVDVDADEAPAAGGHRGRRVPRAQCGRAAIRWMGVAKLAWRRARPSRTAQRWQAKVCVAWRLRRDQGAERPGGFLSNPLGRAPSGPTPPRDGCSGRSGNELRQGGAGQAGGAGRGAWCRRAAEGGTAAQRDGCRGGLRSCAERMADVVWSGIRGDATIQGKPPSDWSKWETRECQQSNRLLAT